jgi:curli biogenesis system outer membrane secretion channel CsgG
MNKLYSTIAVITATLGLGACTAVTPIGEDMKYLQGPATVVDVTTVYDDALMCAREKLGDRGKFTLAVGEIADATGKFSAEGNGYYMTQAAGDIMQASFVKAQPKHVANRRNTAVMELEMKVGRKLGWVGSDAHATGSINTLDFIPGGGIQVSIDGVGGKARQYRMAVGMDLFLTDTVTSMIVASTSLNKQIVATDYGIGIGRFFGNTLVTMNIGEQQREAVGFATRNMLKLGAFELLSDLYRDDMPECRAIIDNVEGVLDEDQVAMIEAARLKTNQEQASTAYFATN